MPDDPQPPTRDRESRQKQPAVGSRLGYGETSSGQEAQAELVADAIAAVRAATSGGTVVRISGQAETVLAAIAESRDSSLAEALGAAIATHRYLSAEIHRGSKVLLQKPDGTFRLVVLQ